MTKQYILSIDQGTTGTTVLLINHDGQIIQKSYREIQQIYPKAGWVEHCALDIWESVKFCIHDCVKQANIEFLQIAGIGITNQRETTILWDKNTGEPVHNAIVWQCRRTAPMCEKLKNNNFDKIVREKTGLVLDAYFSGTKIAWMLENVSGLRKRAENGEILFGTVDSWLIWKLTGAHITDFSNASRTLIYNIFEKKWDNELCENLGVPMQILPEVKKSSEIYGMAKFDNIEIPVCGNAGDQQAALFGQMCWQSGEMKNTYGTGCFLLMNAGNEPIRSENGLLTTLACDEKGKPIYALEGSVFIAGAAVQWLRDELQIINHASETEQMALDAGDNHGVYFVPAFVGLGAPHWNMDARGTITGLTRGANRNHIVRATLESLSYQTNDVICAMEKDADLKITELKVDGGAVANNFLMQFQSDISDVTVIRPKQIETTALGAAFLAGLACGFWKSAEDLKKSAQIDMIFEPKMNEIEREKLKNGWNKAISNLI